MGLLMVLVGMVSIMLLSLLVQLAKVVLVGLRPRNAWGKVLVLQVRRDLLMVEAVVLLA